MTQNIFCFIGIFWLCCGFAQESHVEVTDQTMKVGGTIIKELYFGFEAGDEVIFNFSEAKGKPLKEVKIDDINGNPKFSEFKATEVVNKRIKVNKKTILRFTFRNTSLGGRVCKIHIQRIPASPETANFNTNIVWKTVFDTTYTPYTEDSLVGYDSIPYQETIRELVKTEIVDDLIMDKTERVHSYLNSNPSRTAIRVDLPKNIIEPYKETRTVAWAYWIGVGDEARQAYVQNVKAFGKIAGGVASLYGSPLAGIAVGAITELVTPKIGEDVLYYFVSNYEEVQKFKSKLSFLQWNQGKGIAAYGKYDNRLTGTFYIALRNDNNTVGIDVNVKIVVIREIKTYEDVLYDRVKVTPRYTVLNKVRMNVDSRQIRWHEE